MQHSAVIRLLNGQLFWYPPGSSDQPRALSDEGQVEQLESLAAARRAPLIFAVPAEQVILREVTFTAAEKRHISRSLPFMLEEEFAEDIESLHFASRPLARLSMGVAACSHDAMEHWREQLSAVPDCAQWIPEPLLLPWQAGELCILVEAERVLVRSGANEGFGLDRELAGMALQSLAKASGVDASGVDAPGFDTVVVYGRDQSADLELLPPEMREQVQWRTGDFAAALLLSQEDKQAMNLGQGEYGTSLPLRQWWQQWRLVAGLFAAAFGMQVASTWANYSQLESENLQLRQQVEAAYREAVPQGRVVDPEKQLNDKLQQLRGGGGQVSFVVLMDRIGRVIGKQRSAQLSSVNFNDRVGDVRLTLVLPDFRAVEAVRTQLDEEGLEAVLENSNAQGSMVRARLKVRAR